LSLIKACLRLKPALRGLLPLAVVSLCLALAAACGGDDSASSTPTISVGGSVGVSSIAASTNTSGATQSAGASGSPQVRTASPTPAPTGPEPAECVKAAADAGLISQAAFAGLDSIYPPGEQVGITLILANCGDNTATLYYPTSQRYDFIIADANSVEVWRSSDGKTFGQVEGTDELAPNDRKTYEDTWDQKDRSGNQVPDGRYKVSAFSVGCSIAPRADCEFGPIGFIQVQTGAPQ
jgi:hypothetical protein